MSVPRLRHLSPLLCGALALCLAAGLVSTGEAGLRLQGDANVWDNRFGLLRRDFSPRQSYWAVRSVLRKLGR